MADREEPCVPDYARSARRDFRIWAMLAVGLFFAWAGSVVDPLANCDDAGDCAPWLVPVAKWMGIVFALAGGAQLWINPRRGSCVDPATGDLIWWQRRAAGRPGDEGRIHPDRIGRILIQSRDGGDQVHLFDREGERLPYFDEEVIPWPHDRWAGRLIARWPHVRLEEK